MKSRRAAVMSAPVVAMGCFCWPWPGGCGWRTHDVGDCRCRGMGWRAWEGKIKLVDVFVGLLSAVEGGCGPGGSGRWDGAATTIPHLFTAIVTWV